ncbi:TPA: twin-arginine translocase TatA/TatE family subunit [Aeromonas dhakensis]|nr:twin-arginine translocase TatA/TatE family subunit [Aeromonas dhakensis]
MGLGGIHIWHLLILLVVVVVVFGSKRLAGAGEDLGTAIRDFRKALRDDESQPKNKWELNDVRRRESGIERDL